MILVIDNYDSFTYNLVQIFGGLEANIQTVRNDAISPRDVYDLNPSHLILSPGPGRPERAGICPDLVRNFSGRVPILGVCLGHQVIGSVFGARIVTGTRPVHGKTEPIYPRSHPLFDGLPCPFEAGRYHSLVVDPTTVTDPLEVLAESEEGGIMALRHRDHPTYGVQFHPESVLTAQGRQLLANFLKLPIPLEGKTALR